MRAIVTGQVGMDKKAYLQAVAALASQNGRPIDIYHVGDMMYAEAPDVRRGRILDLPLSRLNSLRRSVLKDIITLSNDKPDVIVNTHATFRWRHGLFSAFDFDQIRTLKPNLLICLVDNIEMVHHRLHSEHTIDATLKDLMVWREEEIMATQLLAQALEGSAHFYILARGRTGATIEIARRLIVHPDMRTCYPSFPMSHVGDLPEVCAVIDGFRAQLSEHFITFDPGEVDEKLLLERALAATEDGRDFIDIDADTMGDTEAAPMVSVKQVTDIAGDIDGQIYARDFMLIDQSDMIVSLVPQLPSGIPALSSGVERELQHAFEHGKEVYVVWQAEKTPSPFITETATKVFATTAEALEYFEQAGMFAQKNLFGH